MTMTQAQFAEGLHLRIEEQLGFEGLTRKDVRDLLDAIGTEIGASLRHNDRVTVRGVGTFTKKKVAATKARKGISPFTKEETTFKAKPAHTKVKARPAKSIIDMASKK